MENWKKLIVYTTFVSYFYIFMEWLFFVTKPSFMSGMSIGEKLTVLLVSGGGVALTFVFPVLVLMGIYSLLRRYRHSRFIFYLAILLPALLLSILMLIMVDNFTYTIFKFGIVTSVGVWRGAYGIFFLCLLWVSIHWALRFVQMSLRVEGILMFASLMLVSLSFLLALEQFITRRTWDGRELAITLRDRPHILLIGSDGVNAENMSVYGYERPTTPFLEEFANSALVAENAFSNWGTSAGSTISMLTGKTPFETQVYKVPDILTGVNAYQHLPGILRRYGYYAVQLGVLDYVDAYAMNLQDAFDVVNGRMIDQNPFLQEARKLGMGDATYFIARLFERASDRLLHIFYFRDMVNPLEQVTTAGQGIAQSDAQKIETVIQLLENTNQPVFIHVHLMGTHGPRFSPPRQVFSEGKEQDQEWMPDFYDDAILAFDSYLKEVYDYLVASGMLDNTIIVIYSDHGMGYQTQRVPLLIRFPAGVHKGRVKNNVQNLDIAPTILDYLGIPVPSWMQGYSLLDGEPPQDRLLVIGQVLETQSIVQCENWYRFDSIVRVWLIGEIRGHTLPCHSVPKDESEIPPEILSYFDNIYGMRNDFTDHPLFYFVDFGLVTRADLARTVILFTRDKDTPLPLAKGIFADVPLDDFYAPSIEYAYLHGMLESCSTSPLSFCPERNATRQETAAFLLRGLLGSDYVPPPAVGVFADVPIQSPYAPWIEELYRLGITSGCSTNPLKFCPESPLLPGHLQVFLARIFAIGQ